MKIAVVGAGMSGLIAARELKRAGHEVLILEKSRGYGGRMATRYVENDKKLRLDHGVPGFAAHSSEFKTFVDALIKKDIIKSWSGSFASMHSKDDRTVGSEGSKRYFAPGGMNSIGKYLGKGLEIHNQQRVVKLEKIHDDYDNLCWQLKCDSDLLIEADAVVISCPAPQALEILKTAEDQEQILDLIQYLQTVTYDPEFALMVVYDGIEPLEWDVLEVEDPVIKFISNESKKRDLRKVSLVVHSTTDFAISNMDKEREEVALLTLWQLNSVLGKWAESPNWKQLHFWRYSQANKWLKNDFMEISGNGTPLALVGSYMNGNSVEAAYLSGMKLGKHWAEHLSANK